MLNARDADLTPTWSTGYQANLLLESGIKFHNIYHEVHVLKVVKDVMIRLVKGLSRSTTNHFINQLLNNLAGSTIFLMGNHFTNGYNCLTNSVFYYK